KTGDETGEAEQEQCGRNMAPPSGPLGCDRIEQLHVREPNGVPHPPPLGQDLVDHERHDDEQQPEPSRCRESNGENRREGAAHRANLEARWARMRSRRLTTKRTMSNNRSESVL